MSVSPVALIGKIFIPFYPVYMHVHVDMATFTALARNYKPLVKMGDTHIFLSDVNSSPFCDAVDMFQGP